MTQNRRAELADIMTAIKRYKEKETLSLMEQMILDTLRNNARSIMKSQLNIRSGVLSTAQTMALRAMKQA